MLTFKNVTGFLLEPVSLVCDDQRSRVKSLLPCLAVCKSSNHRKFLSESENEKYRKCFEAHAL